MYAMEQPIAVRATESARAAFIRRTYAHLAGAILAFVIIEFLLLRLPNIERIVIGMAGSGVTWLVIVGAFIGVSFLADVWARSDTSPGLQLADENAPGPDREFDRRWRQDRQSYWAVAGCCLVLRR